MPETVIGCPILYIYLFTAWAFLVMLMALTIESAATSDEEAERGGADPDAAPGRDDKRDGGG